MIDRARKLPFNCRWHVQCAIESVKTAADVYMPCDGTVTRVNEQLEDEPQHISIAAEDDGWLMEFKIEDKS